MIYGNVVGGSNGIGKTFIIEDAAGNELVGIVTDRSITFDAGPNDIRAGKVAATQNGVTIGEKVIPSYNTREGYKIIPSGSQFVVSLPDHEGYNFTKFQGIICPVSGTIAESVAAEGVVINDGLYPALSSERLSTVVKNDETKSVDLGITNTNASTYVLRYFTYKEIV